jgi:hypothetical protein
MLDGRRFAENMAQKPLNFSLARVWDLWTTRQSRQLSHVPEFTSDIRHVAGSSNMGADAFSGPPGHAACGGRGGEATSVKAPSGSEVATMRGGKQNFSPTTLPIAWQLAWRMCSKMMASPSPKWCPTRPAALASCRSLSPPS